MWTKLVGHKVLWCLAKTLEKNYKWFPIISIKISPSGFYSGNSDRSSFLIIFSLFPLEGQICFPQKFVFGIARCIEYYCVQVFHPRRTWILKHLTDSTHQTYFWYKLSNMWFIFFAYEAEKSNILFSAKQSLLNLILLIS